jgi:chromosome segregation ATPase
MTSINKNFVTSVVGCAAALACVLSIGPATAYAADVKSPRDSASGQATGKRQHSPEASPDGTAAASPNWRLEVRVDEIKMKLAGMTQQMAELQAMCNELQSMASEADTDLAASNEASTELAAQLDEAQRVFTEQVASLLDEATIAAVTQSLDSQRSVIGDNLMEMDESFEVTISPLLENLGSLEAALSALTEACAQAQVQVSEKHTKSGHVTLLK